MRIYLILYIIYKIINILNLKCNKKYLSFYVNNSLEK